VKLQSVRAINNQAVGDKTPAAADHHDAPSGRVGGALADGAVAHRHRGAVLRHDAGAARVDDAARQHALALAAHGAHADVAVGDERRLQLAARRGALGEDKAGVEFAEGAAGDGGVRSVADETADDRWRRYQRIVILLLLIFLFFFIFIRRGCCCCCRGRRRVLVRFDQQSLKHSCATSMNHQSAILGEQRAEGDSRKGGVGALDVGAQIASEESLRQNRRAAEIPEDGAGAEALSNDEAREDAVDSDVAAKIDRR
jgi:hypothetical protein